MVASNTKYYRAIRFLVMIPLLLVLFACSDVSKRSDSIDPTVSTDELSEKQAECWQASIAKTIYEVTGKTVMGMYEHLTKGALSFMMVAFALWMVFRMLKHVSSFTEESPAEVWTEISRKFFVCLACGLLASTPSGVLLVLNNVIFPIYTAFLELGSEFIAHADNESVRFSREYVFGEYIKGDAPEKAVYSTACVLGVIDSATLTSFPTAPQQMMECMICSLNERMNFGYSFGFDIMAEVGIMALVCGLLLICIITLVKLSFVFYLIDSIFRFAMMVMMMPILIMSFAFKSTKKWATTGFFTILNSGAFMMAIAIVMIMALATIQQILIDNQEILRSNSSDLSDISLPFMMLLLLCFLLVGALGVAKAIADSLVGGGGAANTQKRLARFAAGIMKWAFLGIWGATVAKGAAFKKLKMGLNNLSGDDDDENDD